MLRKRKLLIFGIIVAALLLLGFMTGIHKVKAEEEEEEVEVGHGKLPVWVPYSDSAPTLDGVISANEYPADGAVDLEGFAELFLVHNETHMFVAIEANTTGFLGIGLKPIVEEEEEEAGGAEAAGEESGEEAGGYAFFIAAVNGSSVINTTIVESNTTLGEVLDVLKGNLTFSYAGKESGGKTTVEFAIELYHAPAVESEEEVAGETAEEEFLPRMGYLLELVVVKGTTDDLSMFYLGSEITNVQHSEEKIAYVLRPGESIDEVKKVFQGFVPIDQYVGLNLLFLLGSLGVLFMYFPTLRGRYFSK